MNVCTIIAKNYLAHARVLGRSLAAADPGSRLQVLIIDDFAGYIDPDVEPFDILTPADIGCDQFIRMALRYSVLELSTAVKPWLMRHLLTQTGEPVTYLDPDIRAYRPLTRLDELAAQHGVVLIPHNSRPIPADGRHPSQVDVMIAGIYNLGYLSLAPRPEVDELLDWWADRLLRDCRVDPTWGYFVDQRWFDLAPGFLSDVAIVRDPEYNLAYWNLHERRLERDEGGTYTVDGRPLAFFHFSGFDPERPLVLSRHQDRIDVLHEPVLERLLAEYAREVMAEGHGVSRHWPYGLGALGDGTPLQDELRAAFDAYADEHGGAVESPFTLAGARGFDRWLAEPAPGAPPGISRALARVYEQRADVRGAFPDITGADRDPLLRWAQADGLAEEPLLARAAAIPEPGPDAAAHQSGASGPPAGQPSAPLRGAPWGVNVVGDFGSESGAGELARAMVRVVEEAGMRVMPIASGLGDPDDTDPYPAGASADAPFTVNLVCLDPGRMGEFARLAGAGFFAGRYTIGLWCWPLDRFPEPWGELFSLVEEVWVPSAHVAGALSSVATVPVTTVPLCAEPPAAGDRTRAELGVPDDRFLFYLGVDYRDDVERTNPLAAVDAFTRAFDPEDGAGLVVDCRHPELRPEEHLRLRRAVASRPDVELIDFARPAGERRALARLCDAHVSLHRATAFGSRLAEAMWLARPVVATGYSGNLEYMDADNSRLVEHDLVEVGPGREPYPAGAHWAEPRIDHAAELMRGLRSDPDGARAVGAAAADTVRSRHGVATAAAVIRRRVDAIRATGRARRELDAATQHPPAVSRLPMRIRRGPGPAAPGPGVGAREQLRQAVLRVIRPYTAYQQSINADIATALTELSRHIDRTRDETGAEWADMLAAMRRLSAAQVDVQRHGAGVDEVKRILTLQTDRSVYLALAELHRRHGLVGEAPGEPPPLLDLTGFELRAFSQNGEDGVLAEILRRIGVTERFFVEFGVESGREGNCVYLADAAGWRGLFLEAGDEMYRQLERKYRAQPRVRTIQARVAAANIERLLAQGQVPPEFDILCIDVDGQDYWIWQAIDRFRPRIVVIEYNSSLDPRRQLVQPDEPNHVWDGSDYSGASLGALRALGERKGYRLVHTELSAVNAFFVRADLAAAFPADEAVPLRGEPNYFQRGIHHPPAARPRRYLDVETGRLVPVGGAADQDGTSVA